MAILGCGEDARPCAPVRVESARYASRADCDAAIPAAILTEIPTALDGVPDLSFPMTRAVCRRGGG